MVKDDDQLTKIKNWLNDHGYPLEMKVAQSFKKLTDFDVSQSVYYVDYETNKLREIDLIIQKTERVGRNALTVCYLIECKSTKTKPWLLFVPDSELSEIPPTSYFNTCHATLITLTDIQGLGTLKNRELLTNLPLFKNRKVSYGVTAAFTGGEDIPYKAMMGVSKAAFARSQKFVNAGIFHIGTICIPMIVIDGELFECGLDSSDYIQLRPTNYGLCDWSGAGIPSLVHFVTNVALNEYIQKMNESVRQLFELFRENENYFNQNLNSVELNKAGGSAF